MRSSLLSFHTGGQQAGAGQSVSNQSGPDGLVARIIQSTAPILAMNANKTGSNNRDHQQQLLVLQQQQLLQQETVGAHGGLGSEAVLTMMESATDIALKAAGINLSSGKNISERAESHRRRPEPAKDIFVTKTEQAPLQYTSEEVLTTIKDPEKSNEQLNDRSSRQVNHLGQPAPPRAAVANENESKQEPTTSKDAVEETSPASSMHDSLNETTHLSANELEESSDEPLEKRKQDDSPTKKEPTQAVARAAAPPQPVTSIPEHETVDPPPKAASARPIATRAPQQAATSKTLSSAASSLSSRAQSTPEKKLPTIEFVKLPLPKSQTHFSLTSGPGSPATNRSSFVSGKSRSPNRTSMLIQLSNNKKVVSNLSRMIVESIGEVNPLSADYAFFCGKGETDSIALKIYLPFTENHPDDPLSIHIKKDARVEDVIGYALYEYINEGREPSLPDELCDVIYWVLRIVEDDGMVDEDFPALERTRRIQKFAFDQFALCEASPEQVKQNEASRKQQAQSSATATATLSHPTTSANPSSSTPQTAVAAKSHLLRVHLYSTLEVKQTTTLQATGNMLMSEVFESICKKRKYDSKDYVLKMPDTKTDVPLDKTLDQLKVYEFCVLKRDRGGAGDIFLRPPEDIAKEQEVPRFMSTEEYTVTYKQYAVVYRHFMGRYDRLLTIDGEYIHLMTSESKKLLDISGKTNSYHISSVVACKHNKKKTAQFRLDIQKNHDVRSLDLEASSATEAGK